VTTGVTSTTFLAVQEGRLSGGGTWAANHTPRFLLHQLRGQETSEGESHQAQPSRTPRQPSQRPGATQPTTASERSITGTVSAGGARTKAATHRSSGQGALQQNPPSGDQAR